MKLFETILIVLLILLVQLSGCKKTENGADSDKESGESYYDSFDFDAHENALRKERYKTYNTLVKEISSTRSDVKKWQIFSDYFDRFGWAEAERKYEGTIMDKDVMVRDVLESSNSLSYVVLKYYPKIVNRLKMSQSNLAAMASSLGGDAFNEYSEIRKREYDIRNDYHTDAQSSQMLLMLITGEKFDSQAAYLAWAKIAFPSTSGLEVSVIRRAGGKWEKLNSTVANDMKDIARLVSGNPIHALKLHGASDTDLKHLKGLIGLKELYLRGKQITDAGLSHLTEMKELKVLDLSGLLFTMNVTDTGLNHIRKLTKLRELDLRRTKITDTGLKHLEGLSCLERLDIGNTAVTSAGLEHLDSLVSLQKLSLDGTYVTDNNLKSLANLTGLKFLNLLCTEVSDDGLRNVENLTELQEITLPCQAMTHTGLSHLAKLSKLQNLQLHEIDITDASLVFIKDMTSLRHLDIECQDLDVKGSECSMFTDAGMEHLKDMKELRSLRINVDLTSAGLKHLVNLKKLQSLKVLCFDISEMDAALLANFSQLKNLDIYSGSEANTDEDMRKIKSMVSLQYLVLKQANPPGSLFGIFGEYFGAVRFCLPLAA